MELLSEEVLIDWEADDRPICPEAPNFPTHGWEVSDWVNGLIIGAYGTFTAYSRDDDCFAAWFNWGSAAIEWWKWWESRFKVNDWMEWTGFFIQFIIFFFKSMAVPTTCNKNFKTAKELMWHKNFGFLADVPILKHLGPVVGGEATSEYYVNSSVSFSVWTIIGLILGSLSTWGYWMSGYQYWGLGYAMGGLSSLTFVAIDVWTGAHLIHPQAPYLRYNDNL